MNNVIPFNKKITFNKDIKLIDLDEIRKKYWSHICPNVGIVFQSEPICSRCLKAKQS
jgi:hypothetical protein